MDADHASSRAGRAGPAGGLNVRHGTPRPPAGPSRAPGSRLAASRRGERGPCIERHGRGRRAVARGVRPRYALPPSPASASRLVRAWPRFGVVPGETKSSTIGRERVTSCRA